MTPDNETMAVHTQTMTSHNETMAVRDQTMMSHDETMDSHGQTMASRGKTMGFRGQAKASDHRTMMAFGTTLYIEDSKFHRGIAAIEAEILLLAFFGQQKIVAESGK